MTQQMAGNASDQWRSPDRYMSHRGRQMTVRHRGVDEAKTKKMK